MILCFNANFSVLQKILHDENKYHRKTCNLQPHDTCADDVLIKFSAYFKFKMKF